MIEKELFSVVEEPGGDLVIHYGEDVGIGIPDYLIKTFIKFFSEISSEGREKDFVALDFQAQSKRAREEILKRLKQQ